MRIVKAFLVCRSIVFAAVLGISFVSTAQTTLPDFLYKENHRLQFHFSPKAHWMNDPNGLVFFDGVYHMYFQYYPDSTVWGPNYWGHATSKDLIHWTETSPALAPDSLGLIASGSAVADYKNTSGFAKDGKVPLVAIYAYINQAMEKNNEFGQYQAIAYSLDKGFTWTKYRGNPVVKNPGIRDFRDPKVVWYPQKNKWIMTVATHDHVTYYSSPDLKKWNKESEFGSKVGAHTGVWECPDLFSFTVNGKVVWVQLVSINPGGPNGGSATQYFVGDFDGTTFTPYSTKTKWVDYGTDDYAGVTWSNTGSRRIFLGWMSNWHYAQVVPTVAWRSAMTVPRELKLVNNGDDYLLTSMPVKELDNLKTGSISLNNVEVKKEFDLSDKTKDLQGKYWMDITTAGKNNVSITLYNEVGQEVIIGYNKEKNQYYIDRTKSGDVGFNKEFAKVFTGPRLSNSTNIKMKLLVDVASVELFADDGTTVMTGIYFPTQFFNHIKIASDESVLMNHIQFSKMKSIW